VGVQEDQRLQVDCWETSHDRGSSGSNPSSLRLSQLAPKNHIFRISYSHDRDAVHAAVNVGILFISSANTINLTEG
jgi:hypothetical protein